MVAHPASRLTALHDAPHEDWDVTNLASVAGMSRSRFASRFSESVGQSPHAYLTHWRMTLARELLRSGALLVGLLLWSLVVGTRSIGAGDARELGRALE